MFIRIIRFFSAVCVLLSSVSLSDLAFANPNEWVYRWQQGSPIGGNPIVDNDAGIFEYLEARYDSSSKEFSFQVRLAPPIPAERLARGFALIVSGGNYPHSEGAEFTVFYFDATDLNNPRLVAYPFNAYDQSYDSFSFRDARFYQSGIQLPDKLCTSLDPLSCLGWVKSISSSDDVSGKRTFYFKVDVAIINNYSLTWPNPSGKTWDGTKFQDAFGIWMMPHGHPDLEFFYGADGFLTDVNFGAEYLGQEYIGFFDGSLLPTGQDPYCQTAPMSYLLQVGQPFSTSVTGISPDADILQVNYSGAPAGSSLTPPAGTQSSGAITADFNWTPGASDAGDSYTVNVIFTEIASQISVTCPFSIMVQDENMDCLGNSGGNAEYDICGVCDGDGTSCLDCLGVPFGNAKIDRCGICDGDGFSCLGCSDVDISSTLFDLDGNGEKQAFVVSKLLRKYIRLTRGSKLEESAQEYSEAINAEATELRAQNWNITWSVPAITTQCENNVFCVSVDRAPTFNQYLVNSQSLFKLARQASRKAKKLGGNTTRLIARARKLHTQNQNLVNSTPLVSDVCS